MTSNELHDPSRDTTTMHQNAQCRSETKNTFVSVHANTVSKDDPHTERLGRKISEELFRAREDLRDGKNHITRQGTDQSR